MAYVARQTHLEYYQQHQITPVRYDLSNLDAHMERRLSLYAKIGLLPLTFSNSRILEVAAGTGHNSLYLAQTMPQQLVLLEPNPSGIQHIKEVYENFNLPHTKPECVFLKLEDYSPAEKFDVVLCENWLGTSSHELSLLNKLASFVANQGVLVVTTVSPIGFVPNLLRRFLSVYLSPVTDEFKKRTEILVSAFSTHLASLASMTRSHVDWVHDNMMNPAYFGLCLSTPLVLEQLGNQFDVLATSPSFSEDWRWFKGLHGEQRKTNEHLLAEYEKKSHNFLDYREPPFPGNAVENRTLEEHAHSLLKAIQLHEDAHIQKSDPAPYAKVVLSLLDQFIASIPVTMLPARRSLIELRQYIENPATINASAINGLSEFSKLFGRETSYVSLMRNK
jgi:ubiquinone/menaquinone biosynthesis C-methylase UbiE